MQSTTLARTKSSLLGPRFRRGFTTIEAVMAGAVLAAGLTAAYSGWLVCFQISQRGHQAAEAGQIARGLLETAKLYGVTNLPLGTYTAGSAGARGTAVWTGSFDPGSSTWVTGTSSDNDVINGYTYYDGNGNILTSATNPNARFKVQVAINDYLVIGSTSGYTFDSQSQRCPVVTVTQLPSNTTIMSMGTKLVEGAP